MVCIRIEKQSNAKVNVMQWANRGPWDLEDGYGALENFSGSRSRDDGCIAVAGAKRVVEVHHIP